MKNYTILVILSLFFVGCAGLDPISPIIQLGVMWSEGEGKKYYNTEHDAMVTAVKNVLNDLDFQIIEEINDEKRTYIVADADDKFKIKIDEIRVNITKLSIRVNTMGDIPYADMIFRHVDRESHVKDFVSLNELNDAMKSRKRIFSSKY